MSTACTPLKKLARACRKAMMVRSPTFKKLATRRVDGGKEIAVTVFVEKKKEDGA